MHALHTPSCGWPLRRSSGTCGAIWPPHAAFQNNIWHVYLTRCWFGVKDYFLPLLFSLSSSKFAPTREKFQNNPCSYFLLLIWSICFWSLFCFWISYKIINAFQFHPLLFFNLYIIFQITNVFLISPPPIFKYMNNLSNYKCFSISSPMIFLVFQIRFLFF